MLRQSIKMRRSDQGAPRSFTRCSGSIAACVPFSGLQMLRLPPFPVKREVAAVLRSVEGSSQGQRAPEQALVQRPVLGQVLARAQVEFVLLLLQQVQLPERVPYLS